MSELYQLPAGWEWKRLVEVCKKITDGAHQSPKTIDKGKPYITVRDIKRNGQIDFDGCKSISNEDFELLVKNNCKPNNGDVLLSKDGTVGKVSLVKDNTAFVVLSSLAILSPSNNLLSEFLKNYLLSPYFVEAALNSKTGAAIKRIVLKAIKEFYIPVPALAEQKRIVQKLDALFERIDKAIALLQKNIAAADNFMNSVLNDVFSDLEQNYKQYKLTEIANLVDGDRGSNYPQKSEFFENEYCLFLSTKNVTKSGFMFIKNQFITKEKDEVLRKGKLNRNDLIITTRGTIGNIAIYDESVEYDNVRINSGMAIIRIMDLDKIYNRFLYKYLFSPQFIAFLDDIQSGSAQPQISLTNLKESEFSIPPLKIQQKVVAYLDNISVQIEQVKLAQQQKMQSLLGLKSSILDQAFRGLL